jgi:hypothetical protein
LGDQVNWGLGRTTNVAHGLKIGTFGKNKGMMVTINDEGHLDILYLGVDVPQLTFQNVANREQSYEELRKESVSLKCTLCD